MYADKAFAMAGNWTKFNKLTNTLEFMLLKESHIEVMEEQWKIYENQSSTKQEKEKEKEKEKANLEKGTPGKSSVDDKEEPEKKEAEEEGHEDPAQAQPKAKTKPKAKVAAKPRAKTGPSPKSTSDELKTKAKNLKNLYHNTVSAAQALAAQIKAPGSQWAWAHNEMNMGRLQTCMDTLTSQLTDSDQMILITDLNKMKSDLGEQTFNSQMTMFLKLEDPIKLLERQHKRLLRMHASSQQD